MDETEIEGPPHTIELTIRPPGVPMTITDAYREREQEQVDREWAAALRVDTSEEGLARSAAA